MQAKTNTDKMKIIKISKSLQSCIKGCDRVKRQFLCLVEIFTNCISQELMSRAHKNISNEITKNKLKWAKELDKCLSKGTQMINELMAKVPQCYLSWGTELKLQ